MSKFPACLYNIVYHNIFIHFIDRYLQSEDNIFWLGKEKYEAILRSCAINNTIWKVHTPNIDTLRKRIWNFIL